MNYIVFLTAEGEEKWLVMKALSSNSEKRVKPPAFVFKFLSEWLADFWLTSVRFGSGPPQLAGNVSSTAAFCACLTPSSFIYPIIWGDRFISHGSCASQSQPSETWEILDAVPGFPPFLQHRAHSPCYNKSSPEMGSDRVKTLRIVAYLHQMRT